MIGYITLGTNDLERAAAFYDALFEILGYNRFMESEKYVVWGDMDSPGFSVTKPFNKQAATVGNGVTIALEAPSIDIVNQVHAKALELGAEDEGAVGFREEMPGFYAGYFRDLDGNKLNVHYIDPQALLKAAGS